MKRTFVYVRRFFAWLVILLGVAAMVTYFFLLNQKPQYRGTVKLEGLSKPVDIYYDAYGVPHIYASNEDDLYFALGYVHAQDRLFQMELLRRVSAGRLSEIFGDKFIDVDRFFRTLGMHLHAEASAQAFYNDSDAAYKRAANAYLNGINRFIETGPTPLEFVLAGIPKEKYTVRDMYLIVDYMAFNFAMGFRTDPLMSRIREKTSDRHLHDLAIGYVDGTLKAPVYVPDSVTRALSEVLENFLQKLPMPVWTGSNGWVLSPRHSASGKVLFSNDAHIGFSQPCVWYEAHLECPGFSFYGNHLAGFPFAPIGHSRSHAWGLTMFENDDMDFYAETPKPGDSTMVMHAGEWKKMVCRHEKIRVKGGEDVSVTVWVTPHGPVCTPAFKGLEWSKQPVSVSWTYTKFPCNLASVMYGLSHSRDIKTFEHEVSQIVGPGVNVMYGDAAGNIAWWAAAKLVKRRPGIVPDVILDGASGKDDPQGYYDFSANPKSINPPSGIVASANGQPDAMPGQDLYPGYYVPGDRLHRINTLLAAKDVFTRQEMEEMQMDDASLGCQEIVQYLYRSLYASNASLSSAQAAMLERLKSWDGNHHLESVEPTVYYAWIYRILKECMEDELGDKDFESFLQTHVMKNSILPLLKNADSPWWDNVHTPDVKETEAALLLNAYKICLDSLASQLGPDPARWQWKRVHFIKHGHALGKQKPLDKLFNVGPYPAPGGNETLDQMGFDMNGQGSYPVKFGPSMRITLDFADVENSRSILPTGQSGNVMSRHYSDQAALFLAGKTRKQMMNRQEIVQNSPDKLTLLPR